MNYMQALDDKLPNNSENEKTVTLEDISKLANTMAGEMEAAIKKIQDINEETHVLALNAAIEASSAGDAGKGFGVVAEHMGDLSNETSRITKKMNEQSQEKIVELGEILTTQATNVRGSRLADLALTHIDLIDRNLYERTADIRWWATDGSVINSLTQKTDEAVNNASRRLNIILKFYTIYHDLVICDLEGNVIANGNLQYHLVGKNVSKFPWFQTAINTNNGDDYGFQTVHKSEVINNQNILTFSCKIHENGNTNAPAIGVLASIFNWTSLSQKIVNELPLSQEEISRTRVCIVDEEGLVLADSDNKILDEKIEFEGKESLFSEKKNFVIKNYNNKKSYIAHGMSPGFEGYSTKWHSILIQALGES